ncbi:unnamed protein product [Polarella glacialis]|uniref:Uncharacterized protein n=1 Tax=Polarella glacialis TaxID=89957 RepID=A0A813I451_POLGL|nr:unnamed protein product [Polarella glacialis]
MAMSSTAEGLEAEALRKALHGEAPYERLDVPASARAAGLAPWPFTPMVKAPVETSIMRNMPPPGIWTLGPPSKAGNPSKRGEPEKARDSTSHDRGRSSSRKKAKTSRSKHEKKKRSRRSSTSSSSSSSSRRKRRKKSSKRSKAPRSKTPEPLQHKNVSSPKKSCFKSLPVLMPRDDQIAEFSSLIFGFAPVSSPEDRSSLATFMVDAGLRSLSTFRLFPNIDTLVAKILPGHAPFATEALLREVVDAVANVEKRMPSPSGEATLQASAASSDYHSELAKAIRLMSRDGKPRKKDGVRGYGHPSDSEDEPLFDLSSALTSQNCQNIPVTWFGDTKRLEVLRKCFEKAKTSGNEWPHFIASSTFEEWIPPWVGSGSSPADKINILRDWKFNILKSSPSHAYGTIMSFWLSHAALGIVDFRDVLSHMLCFIKLHAEFGLEFAVNHERRLLDLCQLNLRSHFKSDMPALLASPVPSIMSELQLASHRAKELTPSTSAPKEVSTKGEGKGKLKVKKDKDLQAGESEETSTVRPASFPRKSVNICFKQDTANKLFCDAKAACPNLHLDTKVAEDADRFARAKAAWTAKKSSP